MACGLEVFSSDLGEEPGCGPDPDSGHAGQDRGKRVVFDQLVDHDSYLRALPAQRCEMLGQARENGRGGVCADDHHGLLAQRLGDLLSQTASHAWCQLQ